MNLQAKLTLWYVLLAVLIVGTVSTVNLITNVHQQFDDTLARAEILKREAGKWVERTLNTRLQTPLREALLDQQLEADLQNLLTGEKAILEIAVVDPKTNEIMADNSHERRGEKAGPYPSFRDLAHDPSWLRRFQVLRASDEQYYQLEQQLGPSVDNPVVSVRVIVAPKLLQDDILRSLSSSATVAVLSVVGAICITFLFSTVAFRPIRQLGQQLDRIASGQYEPEKAGEEKAATDEFALISSKVSMLGQRLRGAQYEVSDLRGNIDRLLTDLEDAVFIFNREMRLVFASGSVEKFLGRERTALSGQALTDVFPPASMLGLLIAQAAQTGRAIRNRRIVFESPMDGRPGVGVVLLSVDSLETLQSDVSGTSGLLVRLRDPEAQRKLGRELQTADRLSAISRVSSGVAHEVKNPLNAILLHVEVARSKLKRGDTDVAPQMEIISREILRLDRVVKTFLDFTRPVELKLANVPLENLVGEIVDLARPQADASKIRVNVDQHADHAEVRVDRDLMKQAVLNVVVNAMQAMPDGGELRFEATVNEETAEIRISDTGGGISPELREKIFRLYFTTRKEGSGIGLAMTFRIVQLHDGTIDFTSEPGKGTTFFIRLPIVV